MIERDYNYKGGVVMGAPAENQSQLYTYKDYALWPDEERWELIEGVPYNMSAAPSRFHQEISGALFNSIYNYLKDKSCKVYHAPFDVRLPKGQESEEAILTVVQPDIAVICDQSKLDEKGCKGAPDLVIEIVSPSTVSKDMKEKLAVYERHGVKEYWIIHPIDKLAIVYRLQEDRQYVKPEIYSEDNALESKVLAGFSVDLRTLFQS